MDKAVLLIVEDDEDMLNIMSDQFREIGYTVFSAENGQIALKIAENKKIDLIVSDIQMPVMTGVDLLKNIRQKNSDIPIVLLITGQSSLNESKALELGASGLFHKPFDFEVLAEEVRKLIASSKR